MDRLAAMQTFVKVIDTGSFSAAARQLRVGQPAVSKMVAQLEERLGVTLLLRTSRSFSATDAGRIFYERAKLAIADADDAELAARGASAGLVGRLRVSAAVTFARLKIVPKLGRFLAQHPKLEAAGTAVAMVRVARCVADALAEFLRLQGLDPSNGRDGDPPQELSRPAR
jgi:DNA-binding transcriptional LysR family regulator